MEYLNIRKSIQNCSVCRNSDVSRSHTFYLKQNIEAFSKGMNQLPPDKYEYMPDKPDPSSTKVITSKTILQKYIKLPCSSKDAIGYEQIHSKSLKSDVSKKSKDKFNKKLAIEYQVYTLTTDTDDKPKRKPSRVYSYPYSSSSSETTSSLIGKDRNKSVSMYPRTGSNSNDEDTDSEFDTCHHFPITEKHYRHIVDGIECSPRTHNKQTNTKKKPLKEEKNKITKRADDNFNQINFKQTNNASSSNSHACTMKAKKKCNCKSKCKPSVPKEEGEEERSDSELSEKTFTKFINSLYSYVNKTKKHKHQKKNLECGSSCSFCIQDAKKKKSSKEPDAKKHHHDHHDHHGYHNHQDHHDNQDHHEQDHQDHEDHHDNHHRHHKQKVHQKHNKVDAKEILKKYLHA